MTLETGYQVQSQDISSGYPPLHLEDGQQVQNTTSEVIIIQDKPKKRRSGFCIWYTSLSCTLKMLIILGVTLMIFAVFTSYMLTYGARSLAIAAVNSLYPPQFDIHDFQFYNLTLGPVNGNNITIKITSLIDIALPVTVKVKNPLTVKVTYLMPLIDNTTQPVLVGYSYKSQEDLDLYNYAGYNATLDIDFIIDNPQALALMTDHLLIHQDSFSRNSKIPNYPQINYDAPVVIDIDVNCGEVFVYAGGMKVLTINDLPMQKTVMIRNTTAFFENSATPKYFSIGWFFTQVGRMLAGDEELMYSTSEYLRVGNLTIYDNNIVPPYFNQLSQYENVGVNGSTSDDVDSNPFTVEVTFINPTPIEFASLGSFFVQLNYTDVNVANVTVQDMRLKPFDNTTVTCFGYLKKQAGRTEVIQHLVPNAILKVMTSGIMEDLPFSISGMKIFPFTFAPDFTRNDTFSTMFIESYPNTPPIFEEQGVMQSIQMFLSTRSVMIGHLYQKLGPRTVRKSAIGRMFKDIPVFGNNGLSDVFQGMTVRLGFRLFIGRIPISVFLANPFNCTIAVRNMDLRVFFPPYMMSRPIGWVGGQNTTAANNTAIIRMPPNYNTFNRSIPLLYSNQSDAQELLKNTSYQFTMKYNVIAFMNLKKVFKDVGNVFRYRDFRIALEFNKLDITIGRMIVNVYNVSRYSLNNLPIIPERLIEELGWFRAFTLMFKGWNLVGNGTNLYQIKK